MNKIKKGTIVLNVFILALLLIAAGLVLYVYVFGQRMENADYSEPQELKYHFGFVRQSGDNPYWNMVYEGALQQAEKEGVLVEAIGENLSEEYGITDRMNMAIAENVDGIMGIPDGSDKLSILFAKAVSNNIPVITLMEDEESALRSGYVGINSYEQGQAYGMLIGKISEQKKVSKVVLTNTRNQSSAVIYSSLVEYLNENGLSDQVEIIVKDISSSNIFNNKRDLQLLLDSKDMPDVIICTDYFLTISACQTLVDKNLVGRVDVLGSYVSPGLIDYIKKGTLYGTVAVNPYEIGKNAIIELVELKEAGRTNDFMTFEMMVIDQENADEYANIFKEDES